MRCLSIAPVFLLLACSGGPAGDAEVSCTATVDGGDWTADPALAFWNSFHADSLSLSCATDGSGIVVNVAGYTGPGSYALTDGQTYAQYNGGALSPEPGAWLSTTGTIDVTRDRGGVVEGTFEFEGTDAGSQTTKVIADGVFAVEQE